MAPAGVADEFRIYFDPILCVCLFAVDKEMLMNDDRLKISMNILLKEETRWHQPLF